jgi:hypothetical protein
MNFKLKLLLLGFFAAASCSTPAQAMGERQNYATSNVCNTSDSIKTFTLVSPDEKKSVKETFEVPLRYMNMIFERQGKVDTSLHIAADWNTLEPQCQKDGNLVDGENSLTVRLSVSLNKDKHINFMRNSYSNSDVYSDIFLEKYPNFRIRDRKKRGVAAESGSAFVRSVALYSRDEKQRQESSFLICDQLSDLQTLGFCKLYFIHKDKISVKAIFHASKLDSWEQAIQKSLELIVNFHSK